MPYGFELPSFASISRPVRTVRPFLPPPSPAPAAKPPEFSFLDEGLGALGFLGDVLDRPGNALRGLLAGKPEALLGLIPYAPGLAGLKGKDWRASGQDVLKNLGLIDKENESLLSGAGLAGLATEFLLDPLLLAGGLGATTKLGKAAKLVGGGFKEADAAAKALEEGQHLLKAGKTFEDLTSFHKLPEELLGGARQVGPAVALNSPLAEAGRSLKAAGAPMKLLPEFGEAAKAGQRALLTVGGDFAPIPFVKPLFTLPEHTLVRGAPVLDKLQRLGRFARGAPGIKQVADLFSQTPAGLTPEQAQVFQDALEQARIGEQAGKLRAEEEAARFGDALLTPELAKAAEGAKPIRIGRQVVDPTTGEIIEEGLAKAPILDEPGVKLGPEITQDTPAELSAALERQHKALLEERAQREFADKEALQARERASELETMQQAGLIPKAPPGPRVQSFTLSQAAEAPRELFEQPRVGHNVRFRPKDALGGDLRSKPIVGKVLSRNSNGTFTVSAGGTEFFVPEGRTQRIGSEVYREAFNARQAAELAGIPPEEAKLVKERAFSAREALRHAHGGELPEGANAFERNKAAKELRERFLAGQGFEKMGLPEQARSMPKAIEEMLNSEFVKEAGPPPVKGVEYLSADAAELLPGDKLRLGGDEFTVQAGGAPGKVRLKDGFLLNVPEEYVPVDKGSQVVRGLPGEKPPNLELTPQEIQAARSEQGLKPRPDVPPDIPGTFRGSELAPGPGLEAPLPPPGELPRRSVPAIRDIPPSPAMEAQAIPKATPEIEALQGLAGKQQQALPFPEVESFAKGGKGTGVLRGAELPSTVRRGGPRIPEPNPRLSGVTASGKDVLNIMARDAFERADEARATMRRLSSKLPPEALRGNEEFQQAANTARKFERQGQGFQGWARTGKPPFISPLASPAAADREVERLRFQRTFNEKTIERNAIQRYLSTTSKKTKQAAREAIKQLPPDADRTIHRAVTEAVELGKSSAKEVSDVAGALSQRFKEMFVEEQLLPVPTASLSDPRLHYTTRVTTNSGRHFFGKLNAEKRANLFIELEKARQAKGVLPDKNRLADAFGKKIKGAVEGKKEFAIPFVDRGWGKRALEQLSPENRAWLKKNGLTREFLAYDFLASNTHGSQIQRLPAFQGLTVPELNDVFEKAGARKPVFHENPAAQLFVRTVRHEKVKTADRLFKDLSRGLGAEVDYKKWYGGPMPGHPEFNQYRDKSGTVVGIGINEINSARESKGLKPVMFPTLDTAEAVQKSLTKLLEPKEVGPILGWYDSVTRMLKSWVTRAFPAFHVRNRISNRIQSWLEDVPVAGEHYRVANRVFAGLDTTYKLDDGTVLNRGQMMKEMADQGIIQGGFFESELGYRTGIEKPSWNPLSARNRFIEGAEKASSALAAGPGQLLSGAPVGKLAEMDGRMVEGIDRAGHYWFKRKLGLSPEAARKSVNKALFDYDALSDFEKNIGRRAAFFYTWQRKAIPFMLDRLLGRPAKVRQLTQIAGGAGGKRPGTPEVIPPWTKEGLPFPVGRDKSGNPILIYGLGTPIEGAAEPFTGFAEGPRRGFQKLAANLNPLLRIPIEAVTGKRLFLGREIDEARKAPHWIGLLPEKARKALGVVDVKNKQGKHVRYEMDPYALYALQNSPFGRLSTTAGKSADVRKPLTARALNILSGVHAVSIDEERQKYFALKDAARARLSSLKRRGLVRDLPIFYPTQAGKESPELPEIKALQRALAAKAGGG